MASKPSIKTIETEDYETSFWLQREGEQQKPTITVRGQVLEISPDMKNICVYLSGLTDDCREEWVPTFPEMPGWAFTGVVFYAELSHDIETFKELAQRPWSIRNFRPSETVFLTEEEISQELSDFVKLLHERTMQNTTNN